MNTPKTPPNAWFRYRPEIERRDTKRMSEAELRELRHRHDTKEIPTEELNKLLEESRKEGGDGEQ